MREETRQALISYRETLDRQVNEPVHHRGHEKKVEKIKVFDRLLELNGTMPLKNVVATVKREFEKKKPTSLDGETLKLLQLVEDEAQEHHKKAGPEKK